jgi:chlorophyllide a reductase subunit Y
MGPAGAGSLAQIINAAQAHRARFVAMQEFFAPRGRAEQEAAGSAAQRASPAPASVCAAGAREGIPC